MDNETNATTTAQENMTAGAGNMTDSNVTGVAIYLVGNEGF